MGQTEQNTEEFLDEDMSVDIILEDGKTVNCNIITILTVNEKDYIVLQPSDDNGDSVDGEVWFYRYEEDEEDVNAEPVLSYIDDDAEYEAVEEAFDEFLDDDLFDSMES
ncbi:MAG: DUF1292 domain-containing protein [Lachnospiraceae bacterium]|nr:DUF1292 domain-containing protein [Lachnospiraceae bacterium]